MKKTPLFIVEEHHEAFFVWNYCINKELIQPSQNCLLHVDFHSDFNIPKLTSSIDTLNGSLQRIFDFTYNELSISDFIIAAVYQEIFNQVIWIDQIKNVQNEDPFSPDKSLKGDHSFSIKNKKMLKPLYRPEAMTKKPLW